MRKKTRIFLSAFLSTTVMLSGISFINSGHVNAAETLNIITPTSNQLKGAGYVNIDWSDVSGAKQYKVYIDNTLVTTVTASKCEYYTTAVAMHNLYVKAVLNNNSEVTSGTVRFGVTKKGICADNTMAKNLNAKSLNAGWYYNWGTGPNNFTSFAGMDYVPMIWGAGANNSIASIYNKGYKYLLAYNEPDLSDQSNMSVNTVLNYWPLFTAYDFHLGAPVTAQNPAWTDTTGGQWAISFFNNVDMSTVDFIPLHFYVAQYGGAGAANWFLTDIVDVIYNTYHKPIWITEFAPSDWGYNNSYGRQQCYDFLNTVMDGLDSRAYVERYSWFSFDTSDNSNGAASLWSKQTGQLTALGELYASKGLPEGYNSSDDPGEATTEATSETPTGDYNISVSTSNALLPDNKSISGKTYADLIKSENAVISESGHMGNQSAANAIDEDIGTRWESVHATDPQYLTFDFGSVKSIKEVGIIWETASASNYKVQISANGTDFTDVASYTGGTATQHRLDTITFNTDITARYVRIYGTARSTQYGYSIWDMAIYGSDAPVLTPIESAGVQYHLNNNGIRVIYNVEPAYNGNTLTESGNIIAAVKSATVNSTFKASDTLSLNNLGAYAKKYVSTSTGLSNESYSDSGSANSYVMTFIKNGNTKDAYTQTYLICSYAKYSDGSTVYGDTYSVSIYALAQYLYNNKLMPNKSQHDALYNTVLKTVNSNYTAIAY